MNLYQLKFRQFILVTYLLISYTIINAQNLVYHGLKEEGNVRVSQTILADYDGVYWPKTQVIDSFIYVPTRKGIYRKNLNTIENDTLWDIYAFNNIPIRDFIKKNDSLIGITVKTQDSLMLLSINNGTTYSNHTSSFFFNYYYRNPIWRIAKHPIEPDTFIVLHDAIGVAKTSDFGNSWVSLNEWSGGFQDRFVSYHPNDSNTIFYTGEQKFEESYILNSYDSGETWNFSENIPSHCTHLIAFHPNNPNIVFSGGEGRIAKSTDKGLTWVTKANLPIYIYKITIDQNNPDILYASGDHIGTNENIVLYKSEDGGENWSLFYSEFVENSDGVMDIHLYGNRLIIYTLTNGVFSLDLEQLSINEVSKPESVVITPNPVKRHFKLKTDAFITELQLFSLSGTLVKTYKNNPNYYDVTALDTGVYILKAQTKKGLEYTYKLIKN